MASSKERITLDADLDAWERQPGESARMHARYLAYQRMGRTRTTARVAEEDGKSASYYSHVAWRHHWHTRAAAWDTEQDRLDREMLVEERRKMVKSHLSLTGAMFGILAKRLKTVRPEELSLTECARWADLIMKNQRATLGEPQMTVAVQGAGPGAPPIQLAGIPADDRERLIMIKTELEAVWGDDEALAALDPAALELPEELLRELEG